MSFPGSRNFWVSIYRDKFLLLALAVGLILRGLNSTFGSPSLYISNDEAIAHLAALNMIANKTPISIANYTPLGAYVQIPFLILSFLSMKTFGLVKNVSDFELFILTHEGYFLFIPRLISALFGVLTILVVYKMTLLIFKERSTAIIAAFLTALSFNLVHISHFGRPWSPSLFFLVLAVYFALKKMGASAFISVGLSYGFHQVGILIFPLVLWLLPINLNRRSFLNLSLFIFLITLFSSLTLRTGLIESIRSDQSFLKSGKLAADLISQNADLGKSVIWTIKDNLIIYFIKNLATTDGLIFLFGIIGIAFSYKDKLHKKLITYIVAYFLFASLFFHPLIRYVLPIFILLIPFSAMGFVFLLRGRRSFIIAALVLVSLNAIWWNILFLRTPTFVQARNWIKKNLSPDIPVAYYGGRYQNFAPSGDAIMKMQEVQGNSYSRLFSVLGNKSTDNVRNIVYVSNFPGSGKLEKVENAMRGYSEYYILDYYIEPSERLYNLNSQKLQLVASFNPVRGKEISGIPEPLFDASWNFPTNDNRPKLSMYSLTNAGPYVEILHFKNYSVLTK